ncbi:RluA family pseudouridine synthase [Bacillaceae bacterium]
MTGERAKTRFDQPTIDYLVREEDEGCSLKFFLKEKRGISRKILSTLRRRQGILLNGRTVPLDHPVRPGDRVQLVLPEEENDHIVPQKMALDIFYEDRDLMVINKPSGICVHPTMGHYTGTLANGVIHLWREQGISRKFRPVNRLDKNTSGLLIVAKHSLAHQQLSQQQIERRMKRLYTALVHGELERDEGTIDAPIARKADSLIEREVRADGQRAVTHYRVLKRFRGVSAVELCLETGRTHQIRVHMSSIGHPLLGDDLYGGSLELIARQALHGHYLAFAHPITREKMAFFSALPDDMKAVFKKAVERI